MPGFLKSPLEFMPQIGGWVDGGGGSDDPTYWSTSQTEDAGEFTWTPTEATQVRLRAASPEQREAFFAAGKEVLSDTAAKVQVASMIALVRALPKK